MTRRAYIIFLVAFLGILYSVGVFQIVAELKRADGTRKDGTIQILDVFKDTFITPIKRASTLALLFEKLVGKIDEVGAVLQRLQDGTNTNQQDRVGSDVDELWSASENAAEETMAILQDIRSKWSTINRYHKADTTEVFFNKLVVLDKTANALYSSIQDRIDIKELTQKYTELKTLALQMQQGNKKPHLLELPAIAAKHFLLYTFISGKYLRGYEKEMERTSIFANTLRPWMQFVRFVVARDLGEKAFAGKGDWMFYRPDIEYLTRPYVYDIRSKIVDPNEQPYLDDPLAAIIKFRDQLAKRGIDLLVVVVPGKPSIYPDMVTSKMNPNLCGQFSHSFRIMKELEQNGIKVVNLFEALSKERKRDEEAGDSVYLRYDTHWRPRGAYAAARATSKVIQSYSWYNDDAFKVEFVKDSVLVERNGDIGIMSQIPNFKIWDLKLSFPLEKVMCSQVYKIERDVLGNEISRRLFEPDKSEAFRTSRILVIGDSFSRIYQEDEPRGAGWISQLAYELSEPLCCIINDGGASTLVRQTLARKANVLNGKKLVIWEFVERDIRFGAEGWKDVDL